MAVSDQYRTQIADECGIEAVIAAMRNHPDAAGVQEQACHVIQDLCNRNKTNQDLIIQHGGLDLIRAAMQTHESQASVCGCAVSAMCNLVVKNDANQELIMTDAGFFVGGTLRNMSTFPGEG